MLQFVSAETNNGVQVSDVDTLVQTVPLFYCWQGLQGRRLRFRDAISDVTQAPFGRNSPVARLEPPDLLCLLILELALGFGTALVCWLCGEEAC